MFLKTIYSETHHKYWNLYIEIIILIVEIMLQSSPNENNSMEPVMDGTF